MNITKFGHCCLLIEHKDLKILTDPGVFTSDQNNLTGIDVILITHEHADHLHVDSVQEVLKNNPDAKIYTNSSVGKILDEDNISYEVLEGEDKTDFKGMLLEAFDGKHEEIFEDFGIVQNTGYFIDNKLFYPGDAYKNPGKEVDTLALPLGGPWCKVPDAIKYAIEVNPKKAFPVHDAMLNAQGLSGHYNHADRELSERKIKFIEMREGDTKEF